MLFTFICLSICLIIILRSLIRLNISDTMMMMTFINATRCVHKCVVCVQMEMSLPWAYRTPSYTPHSWTNNTTWISSLNSATLQPLSLSFQLSTRGVHSVDSRRSIGLNTRSDGNQVTWLIYSKSYYNITVLLQSRPSNSVIKYNI